MTIRRPAATLPFARAPARANLRVAPLLPCASPRSASPLPRSASQRSARRKPKNQSRPSANPKCDVPNLLSVNLSSANRRLLGVIPRRSAAALRLAGARAAPKRLIYENLHHHSPAHRGQLVALCPVHPQRGMDAARTPLWHGPLQRICRRTRCAGRRRQLEH